MQKTLYLVDISSYIFRAYYGIRPLSTSKGIPTNATYGVITMLLKLIREKKPDYLVIVFDSPTPSFRKEIYKEYKANRDLPPEDLVPQFEQIKRFVKSYPLSSLQVDGFEADDIIATMVHQYHPQKNQKIEIVIVSSDKDLMQLIGSGVKMYDGMKDQEIGDQEVEEKFGVKPNQVHDLLSLSGDSSDNIPGVPGIGAKTAAKLLKEWGDLKNLLDHAEELSGKLGENLKMHKTDALLSYQLVTLREDVPLKASWSDFKLGDPQISQLNEFYRELELNRLVQEDNSKLEEKIESNEKKYELITTQKDLEKWVQKIKRATGGLSFDTETTSINPHIAQLVGLSFSVSPGEACYIPVGHHYLGCPEQLDKKLVLNILKPLLEDSSIKKWTQNGKYDMEVLFHEGVFVSGVCGDSMMASYLINPEGRHNLDDLALEYLQHKNILYSDVVEKGKTFDSVPLNQACHYAAEDADITYQLVSLLHPDLKKENLWDCYEKIEIPLIQVLYHMETHGVLVDRSFLNQLHGEFGNRLTKLVSEIYQSAGVEFNIQSPKQLANILFVKLGLPVQRKIKTGYSTDVDVLTTLSSLHPVPKLLLEYRMLSKLQSTYVEQLTALINPKTGRIHTNYNQTIAATGRLSSTDPNLQNIPIRTEEGRRIREAFIASPGYVILSADYSQVELRLLAAFSGDPHLMAAFKEGADIHQMTADKIFVDIKDRKKARAMAKTVNFGIIYGQSPFGLAGQLEIPQGEAKKIIDEFYNQFPSVLKYKEKVLAEVAKTGEVRTWKGRRRLVPEIKSQNKMQKTNAERTAFNTMFQGSAADLIKVAMIHIDAKLQNRFKTKMIMQVHDELVFEVPEEELKSVSLLIQEEMENAIPCEVPLKVDIGTGTSWAKAH